MKSRALIVATLTAAALAGCPDDKGGSAAGGNQSASVTASAAPTVPTATAATTAVSTTAATAATVAPTATATAAVSAEPTASAAVTAAPSGSAAAGVKKWDCGAKGQKPCPMQGWMKGVMGSAASSGDAEKIAAAFLQCAAKPVPGYGQWVKISNDGAAKAKAGDIDGAKKSCESCHALYKKKYQDTMRDKPW